MIWWNSKSLLASRMNHFKYKNCTLVIWGPNRKLVLKNPNFSFTVGFVCSGGNRNLSLQIENAGHTKAEYHNQLDYNGFAAASALLVLQGPIAGRSSLLVLTSMSPYARCFIHFASPRFCQMFQYQFQLQSGKRPRADLNRDRWIQNPEC